MNPAAKYRIESIDLLRGVVMVIMALDHTRSYFGMGALTSDPTNLETTTPILFFTRFITHFCAPVFVFLAGTSAFLYGSKKTKSALLIYLPPKILLAIGLLLVFGHNLLDGVTMEGKSITSLIWYILHQKSLIIFSENFVLIVGYPVLPWIGVMALGYSFGGFYSKDFDVATRKKWLLRLGLGAIVLFLILRGTNVYGDLVPWTTQKNATYTILSFLNVTKYPPSLSFLLITLGPALLFLYATETIKNKFTDFFLVFGRVPFFYYILHLPVIHLFALLGLLITGGDWRLMILTGDVFTSGRLGSYGYPLWMIYLIWIGIVLLLFPLSNKYMTYKANKESKH